MKRSRPWVGKAAVAFIGIFWCGILLYLCVWCPLAFTGDPAALDSVKAWGKGWMVLSGVVFSYLLFVSRFTLRTFRMRGGRIRVGDLHDVLNERKAMFKGLVGGLLCSLPALAITLVGLIVSVPHPEGWVTSDLSSLVSNNLKDGMVIPPVPDSQRAYLVGIDLSRSSLLNSDDPRVSQICKAIDTLLAREDRGLFPELIKAEDTVSFYIFAENQKPLYVSGSALERPSNSQMSRQVCEDLKALADQLDDRADDIGRGRTDIIKFLEDMSGKMRALPNDPWVSIIVFSDFLQDSEPHGMSDRIGSLMSEIGTRGQLVGFTMPSTRGSTDSRGKDIRKFLKNHGWAHGGESLAEGEGLGGGERMIWKEIPLDSMEGQYVVPQQELQRNIYREIRASGGLHLKYKIFPFLAGTPAHLELPNLPGYERLILALRPTEGDDATSKIRIRLGDPKLQSVVMEMGETLEYKMSGSRTGILPIKLFGFGDISRAAEFDLLVMVPDRSVTHTVRLVVLPTVGSLPLEMLRWALALAAITFILLVIGATGADLWFRRKAFWLFRKLGLRKRSRRPSPLAQRNGGFP